MAYLISVSFTIKSLYTIMKVKAYNDFQKVIDLDVKNSKTATRRFDGIRIRKVEFDEVNFENASQIDSFIEMLNRIKLNFYPAPCGFERFPSVFFKLPVRDEPKRGWFSQ